MKTLFNAQTYSITAGDPLLYLEYNSNDPNAPGDLPPRWYALVGYNPSDPAFGGDPSFTITEDGKRFLLMDTSALAENFDTWVQTNGPATPAPQGAPVGPPVPGDPATPPGQSNPGGPPGQLELAGPTNLFVVPPSQPTDSAHFHTLAAAVAAATSGAVVTIEPGASPEAPSPGTAGVQVFTDDITIQGDPNVPANILPSEQIQVFSSQVKLVNLNLSSLTLGDPNSQGNPRAEPSNISVSRCLIYSLADYTQGAQIVQNTITGSASVLGLGGGKVANNTFTTSGLPGSTPNASLYLNSITGEDVVQNSFYGDPQTGVEVLNCTTTNVSSNQIALSSGIGIDVEETGGNACSISVSENTIGTTSAGVGLSLSTQNGTALQAEVTGNDFHNNAIGVGITGDSNGDAGNIDLGGGSLGSLGGNDFRGFQQPATATSAAIAVLNAGNGIGGNGQAISAEQNTFAAGLAPSQAIYVSPAASGLVATDKELSVQQSYVQGLYNNLLGRPGSLAELNGWVSILNSQGQAAVANGILHSSESLGRIVDSFYIRFLGRQADTAGRAAWVDILQQGASLEAVEAGFITSPEYLGHIDTDYVQSLYLNLLGRTGSAAELALWNNDIQTLGLAGIANAFLTSQEYRADNLRTDFAGFLHRPPSPTETSAFVGMSADLLGIEAAVLSSQECLSDI
jgi:Domain of unknown function (DUF4214)